MSDSLSFLLGDEPEPPHRMAVHEITVTHVAYDDPPTSLGIDPSELDYAIDHGECTWRSDDCLVEEYVREIGLHQAMFGVWDKDHRLEQGKVYRVRGWVSVSPDTPNGPAEYDAGIELVDDDDE